MKQLSDINKWSLAEAMCDSMGKSSLVIPMGAVLILAGIVLGAIQGFVYYKTKDTQLVGLTMFFLMMGSGLLGAHKIMEGKLQNILASLPDSPITNIIKEEAKPETNQ